MTLLVSLLDPQGTKGVPTPWLGLNSSTFECCLISDIASSTQCHSTHCPVISVWSRILNTSLTISQGCMKNIHLDFWVPSLWSTLLSGVLVLLWRFQPVQHLQTLAVGSHGVMELILWLLLLRITVLCCLLSDACKKLSHAFCRELFVCLFVLEG